MNRLNADGHDESQYLPRGTPPVNPFREKQGGVVEIGTAIKAMTWLPDILSVTLDADGHALLARDHVETCQRFYSAVVSTRKALGISDIRGLIADGKEEAGTKETDVFFLVMKGLLRYQSNLCLWVVCDEYNRGNLPLARKLIGSIQQSLINAQALIDESRENKKN